ncbi:MULTISPECIES: fluoride efflux transporter CrcB [Pontibacillus]|uniref:Fluoride-specific ion channel FluC n=1 Tax=Pontibacillus chungwhensis TaxID=265426 RepID=A0ABY8UUW4_9BACI|nr:MULTISPECIES: fluoride efflux transporter CrcB [Pontibacillus]MCD5325210.1 fluoride efflux transporter CrcB [Pontibacillus sp. HN14]WIF97457.1 fluoride efflux transporter CrcB [Pontibacillus chungwhensis]
MMFAYVALGGGLGALCRFFLSDFFNSKGSIPYGTWLANIVGSLLLAGFIVLRTKEVLPESIWQLAGVGFCGAFTTFSTFGKETIQLLQTNRIKEALLYVASSLIISLSVVWLTFSLFIK